MNLAQSVPVKTCRPPRRIIHSPRRPHVAPPPPHAAHLLPTHSTRMLRLPSRKRPSPALVPASLPNRQKHSSFFSMTCTLFAIRNFVYPYCFLSPAHSLPKTPGGRGTRGLIPPNNRLGRRSWECQLVSIPRVSRDESPDWHFLLRRDQPHPIESPDHRRRNHPPFATPSPTPMPTRRCPPDLLASLLSASLSLAPFYWRPFIGDGLR
jgi:hypothetical protein